MHFTQKKLQQTSSVFGWTAISLKSMWSKYTQIKVFQLFNFLILLISVAFWPLHFKIGMQMIFLTCLTKSGKYICNLFEYSKLQVKTTH